MKKKLIYLFMIVLLIQSCTSSPILEGETPFVVDMIIEYDDTHSIYHSKYTKGGTNYITTRTNAEIVLPTGYYQIGDTITICDPKKY